MTDPELLQPCCESCNHTPLSPCVHAIECVESGHVLTLPYDEVRALYFENPRFGFYFLQLASGRLLQDKARAEDALAAERAASATNAR